MIKVMSMVGPNDIQLKPANSTTVKNLASVALYDLFTPTPQEKKRKEMLDWVLWGTSIVLSLCLFYLFIIILVFCNCEFVGLE